MKISIITAVYNRGSTVADALASVSTQTYPAIEHVIIDGGSTDGTLAILQENRSSSTIVISEPDNGIYDALSKGLALATGEVIGLMHSDDTFAGQDVVATIARAFEDPDVEAVYGDLLYVASDNMTKVIRYWKTGHFTPAKLRGGWMPPHPTLYLRRSLLNRLGGYDTKYHIAADYDAILRYFSDPHLKSTYIPEVLVKMRVGGESNKSIGKILRKSYEDYLALKNNNIGGFRTLTRKNLSKLPQFITRRHS